MPITRILSYLTAIIAAFSVVLAIVTRFFIVNKVLLGLSPLSYLRFSSTMLLLTIVLIMFEFIRKYKARS